MKRSQVSFRGVSLLVVLAMFLGLVSPALAASAPESGQAAGSSGSVVDTHYSDDPSAYEIYPVPHSVTYSNGQFTMTDDVNVVVGDGVDKHTTDFLKEILERFERTMTTSAAVDAGKTNIVLAIHGDNDPVSPSAVADLFTAQDKYDPYILTATADASENTNGIITIVGKNTDCVYYGLATLQMMFTSFNGEKFLPVRIEDYSNTIFRGFIEGFYGGFDYTGRESQMRAIRDVKGNMYVFASKTDPYHGAQWSTLYPTDELNQIKHLVDVGKEVKVNYTWSVHIGKGGTLNGIDSNGTINETLYGQRLELLEAKFQQLYDIGVRSFNVLNDDYNSGTYRVQVRFLNDINTWLKGKGDCMPLIYCCQGYNVSWAGTGAEAEALAGLDDDIYLYWTGANVNSPITQESVEWLSSRSGQGVVTWINYPCSEHAKSGLFLGDISHYVKDANGLTGHYGILSNAINAPEANKVAYFQLLSWAWNRENYTSYLTELWEDSFKYLQPEVYESYLTIARNVSNCPGSGRVPAGFPESEYIKDALAAVQTAVLNGTPLDEIPEAQDLLDKLDNILDAIADFRANCDNAALKTEMEPWLKSLESVATAAKKGMEAAGALAEEDVSGAWNAFSEGAVALGQWDANRSSNPNYDAAVMAKAGSRRLQPFASAVLDYVEAAMALQFSPGGIEGAQSFYAVLHGVERRDDTNSAKIFDGNSATFASYHDGTGNQQQAGDYYGVDLGTVKPISAVDILQGNSDTDNDYFHKATLECSADGENWTTLVTKVNSRHIHVEELSVSARYVRLRLLEKGYGSKNDFWTHIREFTVTEKEAEQLYTNAGNVEARGENAGGSHTLTIDSATLASGDYVGIRLPQLTAIQIVSTTGTLPDEVTLEYSVNGETWTQDAPTSTTLMGYVRLRATAAATLENVTLTVSGPVETVLSFVSSNVGVYAGAWTNVVDGDRSTLVHTNTRQAYGQYAIFDLSAKQPVHDITVWIPESGSDIPHNLDIFVGDSADPEGDWTLIAELRDNHYNMDVPYRYFSCDGGGAMGRYIKLAIANVEALNWVKINELEVNTTVSQQELPKAVTATSGSAADAADGDLLTFFTPDAGAAGSWTKYLQAPTALTSVTVLRGAGGASAAVEVQQNNAWKEVGTLTESATTIQLSETGAITGLRITWTASDVPAIAEVILSGEAVTVGDAPAPSPNIYEQPGNVADVTVPNGTAIENVSLPNRVDVTDSAGNTVSAPVTWTCGDYNGAVAGTYTFTGQFTESDTLFNPGCFTLTANVTVNPAASTGETPEQNLALDRPAYASGREVNSQGPAQAVDGDDGTLWSSNKMKQKDSSTEYETIENAVSWITVDLGTDVSSITQVKMQFNAKVWPLEYYVQAGGTSISYDGYNTPSIDTNYSTSDTGNVTLSTDYTGTMHALNAEGWTTIYSGTETASNTTNPTITLGDNGDAAFTVEVPAGTRYIRIYFTQINPKALAGTGIGLTELTVTGTRKAPAVDTNIDSLAPASATGTVGTAFDDLDLPDTVIATLGDGSTVRVGVTWDGTGYDSTSTDAQTFTGTITLPGGVTNNNNVPASLTLTLSAAPTIVSGSVRFTPDSLSVANGTAFADLGLPTQGTATLTDGSTVAGTITWTEGDYNATQAGEQTISGTFASGGKTASVSIQVTVAAPQVIKHIVIFQSEGSTYTTVEVIHGQAIGTLPTPTTRDGYTFRGWFYGEPETRLTEEYVVNGDLTVTAKWTLNQYTVTFDTQGGSAVTNQMVDHGGLANKPADPTRTGYTFGGWYTGTDWATEYDFTTPVRENITLYAKWTANTNQGVPSGGGFITPPSTTTTTTNPDGSTTTTVTDNRTGTVTETTEKPDGSTETVETKKDGTVTATTEKPDGTTEVVETKADGTITATTTDPEGGKVEKVTTPDEDVTITVTGPEGETLAKVELPAEIPASPIEFVDVPEGHWAESAINQAAGLGLVQGVGGNRFDMGSEMKRGDLAVVLYNLSNGNEGYEVTFDDVPAAEYYAAGVAWAVAAGVVNGYSDTEFGPEDTITREQLAVMLYRYAELLKLDTAASADELSAFNDGGNTSRWAVDGMAWCVKNDILQGWGGGILAPGNNATRAEVVVMLRRFMELLG